MSVEFAKLHTDIAEFLRNSRIKTPDEIEIGSKRLLKGMLAAGAVAAAGFGAIYVGASNENYFVEYAGLGVVLTASFVAIGAMELWERNRKKWVSNYLNIG